MKSVIIIRPRVNGALPDLEPLSVNLCFVWKHSWVNPSGIKAAVELRAKQKGKPGSSGPVCLCVPSPQLVWAGRWSKVGSGWKAAVTTHASIAWEPLPQSPGSAGKSQQHKLVAFLWGPFLASLLLVGSEPSVRQKLNNRSQSLP